MSAIEKFEAFVDTVYSVVAAQGEAAVDELMEQANQGLVSIEEAESEMLDIFDQMVDTAEELIEQKVGFALPRPDCVNEMRADLVERIRTSRSRRAEWN